MAREIAPTRISHAATAPQCARSCHNPVRERAAARRAESESEQAGFHLVSVPENRYKFRLSAAQNAC
jgi:hypothetical protein